MAIKKDEYVRFNIWDVLNLDNEIYKQITGNELPEEELNHVECFGFVKFFGPTSQVVDLGESGFGVMNGTAAYVECEVTGRVLRLVPESLQYLMTAK
jgi:hypothetical protein